MTGRQERAVVEHGEGAFGPIAPLALDLAVVLERARRGARLGGDEGAPDVAGVILYDVAEALIDEDQTLAVREHPDRHQPGRYLDEAAVAQGQKAARAHAGEARLDAGPGRVEVLEEDGLVAGERRLEVLVLGSEVEDRPVDVVRESGEAGAHPLLVVGAELFEALRPGKVDGAEACRIGVLGRRADHRAGDLDVGQRAQLAAVRVLDGDESAAERVAIEPGPAERAIPGERHLGEERGLRRHTLLPVPIADDVEVLRPRPDGGADGQGPGRRRRVGVAHDQELAARLRDADFEGERAELFGRHLEELLIHQERRGLVDRHEEEHRNSEPEAALVLERPRQEPQLHRLDDLHAPWLPSSSAR